MEQKKIRKFTTSCFIRRNTAELHKKLEELGYEPTGVISNNEKLCIATVVSGECAKYTNITEEMFDTTNPHETWNCAGRINCGIDENLFLALAALREDTDMGQLFCDGIGLWEKTDNDLPSQYMQINGHKATVEEIIEFFKDYDY